MSLEVGTRLAHYDVTAHIGDGDWARATAKTRRSNHGR